MRHTYLTKLLRASRSRARTTRALDDIKYRHLSFSLLSLVLLFSLSMCVCVCVCVCLSLSLSVSLSLFVSLSLITDRLMVEQ